jgi:hypothetical protein
MMVRMKMWLKVLRRSFQIAFNPLIVIQLITYKISNENKASLSHYIWNNLGINSKALSPFDRPSYHRPYVASKVRIKGTATWIGQPLR